MKTTEFNKFYKRYLTGEFICTHRHKDLINVDVVKTAQELCSFEVSYTDLDFKFERIDEIGDQLIEFMEYIEELEKTDKYKALIHLAFYFQEEDKGYKKVKIRLNKKYYEELGMNLIDTTISYKRALDDIENNNFEKALLEMYKDVLNQETKQ